MPLAAKMTNPPDSDALTANWVAPAPADEVMRWLGSSAAGLSSTEASARLECWGPNAVRTHQARRTRGHAHRIRRRAAHFHYFNGSR
jgi:hypothetical protein